MLTSKCTQPRGSAASPPKPYSASRGLDLWPPDPQSWSFHALVPCTTRANFAEKSVNSFSKYRVHKFPNYFYTNIWILIGAYGSFVTEERRNERTESLRTLCPTCQYHCREDRISSQHRCLTCFFISNCVIFKDKKLSCRRETSRRFVSLNILLSHSRSLKVIRSDTVEYGVCMSLLVFHWNYVCISYRFWDIQRQRMA